MNAPGRSCVSTVVMLFVLMGCAHSRIPYYQPSSAVPAAALDNGAGKAMANVTMQTGTAEAIDNSIGSGVRRLQEFDIRMTEEPLPLRLEERDVVRLLVLDRPELTFDATVQRNGMIALPLAGEIPAKGRTIAEIRAEAAKKIRESLCSGPLRLEIGDVLKLTIWLHPDLTHLAAVQSDGMISLPLIGEVKAAQRSIGDLREDVQKRLSAYLKNPQVSLLPERLQKKYVTDEQVSVLPLKVRSSQVAILGEVFKPGLYPIQSGAKVMEVLAQAHYQDTSSLNNIIVIRNPNASVPQYRRLKLDDFLVGIAPEQNIYLSSDDIVIVPKSAIAKVDEFIDKFFARTKPAFDWWIALQEARYAEDIGEATKRLNELLFRTGP